MSKNDEVIMIWNECLEIALLILFKMHLINVEMWDLIDMNEMSANWSKIFK